MKPAARLGFLDALKGLAILGVVFIHMGFASRFDAAALHAVDILQEVFAWSVLAFFFASGWLHRSSGHAEESWPCFAKKRASRLLVPCMAFSWLYKALLLAANRAGFMSTEPPSLATGMDFAQFILTPAAPQFYCLVHLFLISTAAQAMLRLPGSHAPGNATIWLVAAALLQSCWLSPLHQLHGEALTLLPLYAALYLAGMVSARTEMRGLLRNPGFIIFVLAIGIIATANLTLLHISAPLALSAALHRMPAVLHTPLAFLGRRSGAIYAWHTPLVMPLLSIVLTRAQFTGWLLIAAMILATLTISLTLDSLVRRFDKCGIFRL